jgi:hypothetical protein
MSRFYAAHSKYFNERLFDDDKEISLGQTMKFSPVKRASATIRQTQHRQHTPNTCLTQAR